jgi:hypothetical protein
MTQVATLDKEVAKIAKVSYNLGKSFPTSATLLDRECCGLGAYSLTLEYAQISTARLVRALEDKGMLGNVTKRLLDLQRDKMGGAPVEEMEAGEARFCTLLRQLAIMNRHEIKLTIANTKEETQVYSQQSDNASSLYTQDEGRLSALLRADPAGPQLMQPLHELGIHHMGELVSNSGTHMISSTDLQNMHGSRVKPCHKVALNQLTIAICRRETPEAPKAARTTQPLPLVQRELPPELKQPYGNPQLRRTAGTKDIQDLLTQTTTTTPATRATKNTPEPHQTEIRSRKLTVTARQHATHKRMARSGVLIGATHIQPSEVQPEDEEAMARFWQERQDLFRSQYLRSESPRHDQITPPTRHPRYRRSNCPGSIRAH